MILRSVPATAGEWTVVVVGDTVLAVDDPMRVDDLATRLAGPEGFRQTLERLVSAGIAGAPDFALVEARAGVMRVVLRGAAEVDAGLERVSGHGVTTWTERMLEGATALRLRVPGSAWIVGDPAGREDAIPDMTLAPPYDVEPASHAEPAPDLASTSEPAPSPGRAEPSEPYTFLFDDPVASDDPTASQQPPPIEQPLAPVAPVPSLALVLPDGAVESLTAPLLVGRSPSDPGHAAAGGIPRLVAIAAGDKDISRTHARIEAAGGAVVVTDLDSRNGTVVTQPGSGPRRLRAHEPAIVLPDTVIDLGGGVIMTVTESP